jgi:hypothetical protein
MTTPKRKLTSPLAEAPGSATARNLAWAERELMKMQAEESDPQLRALWRGAARIARERIYDAAKSPNDQAHLPGPL